MEINAIIVCQFSIRYALTVGIGVDSNQQHPLPWYPPTCPTITPPDGGKGGKSEWVDFAAMLGKWSKTSSNYEAETHLKKVNMILFDISYDRFLWPLLQIMCRYIARYYVKIMLVRLGVIKRIFPVSLGGGGETEYILNLFFRMVGFVIYCLLGYVTPLFCPLKIFDFMHLL